MYKINSRESTDKFDRLKSYGNIYRIRVENYDGFNSLNLLGFPSNQGLILEFIDSKISLEDIIDSIRVNEGVITTIRIKFTREYQKPIEILRLSSYKRLPCERLIIDYGARIDCTNIEVQQLVLYNILSAINIDKAMSISSLVIVHSYNVVEDNIDNSTFDLPSPSGLNMLVIPEGQEFNYKIRETKVPDIVGIIPSSYYPSRFAIGIQHAREPISTSQIPDIIYEIYSENTN